ncbi:Cadherin-related family member 2 [Anabarilius grahami]|uniref:Cadherin-related family member 2 n=1 Tax=Anabarilius grahami TaxID=495550 RepID=A0A3N0Y6R4_ANAGA|nr:Cadherin-related family member 2 [Anabarilius grahami]
MDPIKMRSLSVPVLIGDSPRLGDSSVQVTIKDPDTVDYETKKVMSVQVWIVTINIVDINDNAPEFIILQEFYVVVIEKVEVGTSVAKVYAKDRDIEQNNRKTTFEITKVVFIGSEGNSTESLFLTADSPTQEDAEGIFTTHIREEIKIWKLSQMTLDNNKRGKFMVEVQASNPDGLISTSVVEVGHFHPYN